MCLEGLDLAMEHDMNHIHHSDALTDVGLHMILDGLDILLVPSVKVLGRPRIQPLQRCGREFWDSLLVPQRHVGPVKPLMP